MKTQSLIEVLRSIGVASAMGIAAIPGSAADHPSPTPTPRPGTLAEFAARITLGASGDHDERGHVVINDANLSRIAGHGTVTIGGAPSSSPRGRSTKKEASPSQRATWRKRYFAQKRVISGLERKKLRIENEIDLVEDGRLTAGSLARLQRAELELRAVEQEVRHAKLELGRLVREARRHGAEPGWFR